MGKAEGANDDSSRMSAKTSREQEEKARWLLTPNVRNIDSTLLTSRP